MASITIRVGPDDFDLGAEYAALVAGEADSGAVVAFVGRVRDLSLDRHVAVLELEHYPGMTEKALAKIADSAAARWPLTAVTVVHRVGPLHPADQIVLVLTASAHRHAAYDANAYIMDYLKTEAPFWKRESDGQTAHWVDARDSDSEAIQRWHPDDTP
ncbi:molybdopterin synthase catalytic subunit MoaE [Jeongeupia naejangsanensis]|uniref:Molybdopterin synthase catalytic subunit n=1 Tax=Jeongeupia naejangsanensis TaxID=613195 RepID=A0ABS2BK00_9NEIS|nr:molybdopterin synthase catalytic subunit MoaE [Jeongeupia naejangsanensis]MBM3115929.1 molybdopterin synthase catalytic subunit MoaE [Jeongeupia naejangsanensis]